ncbi:MAG: hypothetical protein ACRYGG_03115, partial [Janthinobacterium lividum]
MVKKIPMFINKYQITFPDGNCRASVARKVSENFIPVDEYVQTALDVVQLVNLISEFTEQLIEYSKRESSTIMYPTGKALFDFYLDMSSGVPELAFFRPVLFTSSYKSFLEDFQESIFELFKMANQPAFMDFGQKTLGVNQKKCDLKFLINNPSRLLECYDKTGECIHAIK